MKKLLLALLLSAAPAFAAHVAVYKDAQGNSLRLFQTGCAMVVTTGYPTTAHRVNYVHNLFQNGAATLSGLVEMYHERVRRGELVAGARACARCGRGAPFRLIRVRLIP